MFFDFNTIAFDDLHDPWADIDNPEEAELDPSENVDFSMDLLTYLRLMKDEIR